MPAEWFLLSLALAAADGITHDQTSIQIPDPTSTPSMEMLEFLGAWEDQDGEWIDPLQFEQPERPEHADPHAEHDDE